MNLFKRLQMWISKHKKHIDNSKNMFIQINNRLELLESLVKVGVNINCGESDSWVVMCIAGKSDYVEFFRLPDNGLIHLQQIIKSLQEKYGCHNVNVDVPPYAKQILRL